MEVEIKTHTKEVTEAVEKAIQAGLEQCGLIAEGHARKGCPVRFGNLRDSIDHAVDAGECYVGTNVEYGPYVEYNEKAHHKVGGPHFLKNAVADHVDEYEKAMRDHLRGL